MPEGLVQWLDATRPEEPAGAGAVPEIAVFTQGPVPAETVVYARDKVNRVIEGSGVNVLFARVKLIHREDPAVERPAVVEASLDVDGRPVRAHRAAHQFHEAVDLVVDRLRDRLKHLADHRRERARRGVTTEGAWRHAAPPTIRPGYFPRPPEERDLVSRKTFAFGEMTPDEAAFDMELLDHDFYLFREIGSAGDTLLVREAGWHRLLRTAEGPALPEGTVYELDPTPVPLLDLPEALDRMDTAGHPFVFFRDGETGRGHVLYRRYDGHYGLVQPAG